MARYGVFPEHIARDLLDTHRQLLATGLLHPGAIERLVSGQPIMAARPIYVHNTTAETIPAYACMQAIETREIGNQNYIDVAKPTETGGANGVFVFNNHEPIETGNEGVAQNDKKNLRGYLSTDERTALDRYRPTIGQWYLTQDDVGQYQCHGEDDILDAEETPQYVIKLGEQTHAGVLTYKIVSVSTAASSSPYNGLKVASVTIAPTGTGTTPPTLSDLLGESSIDVVDHAGCYFDEDNADLVDRIGQAELGVALSLESGVAAGTLTPVHWVATNICCPSDPDNDIDGGSP